MLAHALFASIPVLLFFGGEPTARTPLPPAQDAALVAQPRAPAPRILPPPRVWQLLGADVVELEIGVDARDPERPAFVFERLDARAPVCLSVGDEGFAWLAGAPEGTPPTDFLLTAPPDGITAVIVTGTMTGFAWEDATGEDGYTFELADDLAFTMIFDSQDLDADVTLALVPASLLAEMNTYYWRVRANNASGSTTAPNAPFSFQVDLVPPITIGTGPFGLTETDGDFFPCFVATAAYGSPMADEVQTLRSFRDRVLMTRVEGRVFVAAYYGCGPALAAQIADHPGRRRAARVALWPCVAVAHVSLWMLDHPLAAAAIAVAFLALARAELRRRRTKRLMASGPG